MLPTGSQMSLKVRTRFDVWGKRTQDAPALLDFHKPNPLTASALSVGPPVEKYIVAGLLGSWPIDETARLSNRSLMFCQLGIPVRKLVHFHKPPAIPPQKTVLPVGSFKVSIKMARVL